MNKLKVLVLPMILLFAGCAQTDYLGKTYAPTSHVDVFFSVTDITRQYEVMGEAKTEGTDYLTFENIEEQLVKDAMARGADAVLIEGMETVTVGYATSTQGNSKESPRYVADMDGNLKNVGGSGHYSEISTTTDVKDKVIHAKLLKYKD